MKKYIDSSIILSELKMLTIDYHCECFLVEGENDRTFYHELLNVDKGFIRSLSGWENVRDLILEVNKRNVKHVLGIIDRDYHVCLNDGIDMVANLILTDYHDIEMMLFCSTSYEKFLRIHGRENKLKLISDCRNIILSAATPLGALRLISSKENYALCFEGIKYADFINRSNLGVDLQAMVSTIYDRSISKQGCIPTTKSKLLSELQVVLNTWKYTDLCSGHDILNILCIAMQKLFSTVNASEYTEPQVFSTLLMGYAMEEFETTKMFQKLTAWRAEKELSGVLC